MAPKDTALTARDMELLVAALKSNKNDLVIDYKKFGELAKLKGDSSGSAAWCTLRKKLGLGNGENKTSPSKPTPTKKRKAAAATDGDDEAGSESPAPKRKTTKNGKSTEIAQDDDDEKVKDE